MDFGIFTSGAVDSPERAREDIQLGVVADRVGFDYFWAPEHHFLEDYSHNSSSHLACLAVGMLTERIRLGTGIFNICPAINHPVRVAEQIAMIDQLTNGRIDLGTGRGSGSAEVNGFGLSTDETAEMWDEAIRAIPKMWTQDLFSWDGKHFSVPERKIIPKPVQDPHPPLWVTASNPGTVEKAARMGLGVLVFNFSDPRDSAHLVETYKRVIEDAEPVGSFVNNNILTISRLLCTEDREAARREYVAGANDSTAGFLTYFDTVPVSAERMRDEPRPIAQSRYRELLAQARTEPPPSLGADAPTGDDLSLEELHGLGVAVGDPDDVKAVVKRFEDVGFDQMLFLPRSLFSETFETTTRSLELVGEHVIPAFKGDLTAAAR